MLNIWIVLIEVRGAHGSDYKGNGAYVNALVPAPSAEHVEAILRDELDGLGWDLVCIEETEDFEQRRSSSSVSQELIELFHAVTATGNTGFGTFNAWSETIAD